MITDYLKNKLIERYKNWLIDKSISFNENTEEKCKNIIENSKILLVKTNYYNDMTVFIMILDNKAYHNFLENRRITRKYNFKIEYHPNNNRLYTELFKNSNGYIFLERYYCSVKTFEAYDFLFLRALSQLIDNSDLNRFINLIKEIK